MCDTQPWLRDYLVGADLVIQRPVGPHDPRPPQEAKRREELPQNRTDELHPERIAVGIDEMPPFRCGTMELGCENKEADLQDLVALREMKSCLCQRI